MSFGPSEPEVIQIQAPPAPEPEIEERSPEEIDQMRARQKRLSQQAALLSLDNLSTGGQTPATNRGLLTL